MLKLSAINFAVFQCDQNYQYTNTGSSSIEERHAENDPVRLQLSGLLFRNNVCSFEGVCRSC